jgi:hypothetical protein
MKVMLWLVEYNDDLFYWNNGQPAFAEASAGKEIAEMAPPLFQDLQPLF